MSVDIASIGIQLDTRQVLDGTKALDALGDASTRVDSRVDSANKTLDAMSTASANVWRRGGEAAKGVDALGDAAAKTAQRITVSNGAMGDTAKLLQMQADQAKAAALANAGLGSSTTQLTLGQQQLIEKFREQATTLGMSRSQLMAYQAAQMGLTTQVSQSVAVFKAQEDAIKAAAKAKDDAAKSSDFLASSIKLLAAAYALLKVGEYIKDASMLAARYETLGVVTEVVGRNAGYTKAQMDYATDAIARQGITMIESRESAIKLVQAHVDLKNATVLARIAQDAAVIGHMNSSDAFDRLVNGIARGNVLILRNIGINVNLQAAYREMADSLGKGTKELTENERVQARLNAVIERGADISGTYTAAMDTAGKQILSMQRYTQDFKTMFGETFNEALTIGVMALTDHLKDSNKTITELSKNNQLEDWGHSLTKVFVAVANSVSNASTAFQRVSEFSRHQYAVKDINATFDAQSKALSDTGNGMAAPGAAARLQRIESARAAALAQENVDNITRQAELSGNFDRFERAAEAREATRLEKRKADAAAKLKVDQDYVAASQALLTANADKSVKIQQEAQMRLFKLTYVGTPDYRDTEGREPKPKVDAAENTRLADQLKRYETEAAAAKAENEYLMKLDDMRHKAGEMGDAEYYANRKTYADMITGADIAAYDKQLAELRKHHNNTEGESAKNAKAIHDIEDKKAAARQKFAYEDLTRDEEERLRQKAIVSASDDAANKYIDSLNAQIVAIEMANGKRAQSASSIAAETAAQLRAAAAAMAVQAAGPDGKDHTQADADAAKAMLVTLNLQADAQERIAAALRDGEAAAVSRKLADQAINDWKNVGASIGDSLTDAFGKAGKAAGAMFKSYADGQARQLQLQKDMAIAKLKLDSDPEKAKVIDDIQRASAAAQLKSYGDLTDAAGTFFDEGSKGYQAMHAASMVLHGAEVALSLVKGVNAVLTQGEGDPYSAFGRMAAMAAVVVGLGVALTGGASGSAGQSAADVQKVQGTGSVFGDSSAKSDSIARSIALSASNSNIELNYTAGMLAALKSIDASMSGLANLVVGANGVTDGSNLGIKTGTLATTGSPGMLVAAGAGIGAASGAAIGAVAGPLGALAGAALGAIAGKLVSLWGKTTQNIVDSGLQLGGSVADLQSGKGFSQYASVDTTKSSWFGLSKSTSNSVQTAGLDSELSTQFGLIFTNLEDSLKVAAGGLGIGADQVGAALDHLVISTTKVSLKDLKGDDLTAAINGVISKTMDEMAAAAIPGLDKFRKVGEGYAETVVRIATDYANVDGILMGIGKTFGWVGTSSIASRENLIALAGGIDELASQTKSFASNFLSQAEQLAPVQKYVNDQLAAMGLGYVKTREQFKDVILGLNLTDPAAQQMYASLMALQEAFAKTHAATVDLTKTEQEIADERKDLQSQLDELTMSSAQLLAKQRDALDASNRGLFDQIQVATAAKKAQDDAKASLSTYLGTMTTFANSVKSFNSSLAMGSLSTLTPEQQYAEARRQFEQTRNAAAAGDTTAQGALQGIENAFLTISQKINGSDAQYSSDLASVMNANDQLAKWAAGQVDVAQASLDALNKSADGIDQLNATMLSVAANMQYLPTLTGDISTPVFATVQAPTIDFTSYGNAIAAPLIAEIKLLREEVKGRRADAVQQVGAQMQNVEVVGNRVAETIVDGMHEAVTDGAYAADNNTRKPT